MLPANMTFTWQGVTASIYPSGLSHGRDLIVSASHLLEDRPPLVTDKVSRKWKGRQIRGM